MKSTKRLPRITHSFDEALRIHEETCDNVWICQDGTYIITSDAKFVARQCESVVGVATRIFDEALRLHDETGDNPWIWDGTYIITSDTDFIARQCEGAVEVRLDKYADTPKKTSGTAPDSSLHLGEKRKDWLRKQGGIQPTIHRLIDDAMAETAIPIAGSGDQAD